MTKDKFYFKACAVQRFKKSDQPIFPSGKPVVFDEKDLVEIEQRAQKFREEKQKRINTFILGIEDAKEEKQEEKAGCCCHSHTDHCSQESSTSSTPDVHLSTNS